MSHLLASQQDFCSAAVSVSPKPGLYALWGDSGTWKVLGLGQPPDNRPLYVGKSEESFVKRPLGQHFQFVERPRLARATSLTGSSSPRRSLAALLRKQLGLRGVPRNVNRPAYFANYGLLPEDDRKLTTWMRKQLGISTWVWDMKQPLCEVEDQVKFAWSPPLNLDIETPWLKRIDELRQQMAADARSWSRAGG